MTDTDDVTAQTPEELLADLGEFHTRTLVSPLPKQPAAMGWQAVSGSMAAGFARVLHALNEVDPAKAVEITLWFQGPFDDGPDPEEHTDWLLTFVAKDRGVMQQWVDDGRRLAEESKEAVDAHEAADRESLRLTLSKALGLGTGAPWDAIQARANELAALADEEQPAEGDTLPAWLYQRFDPRGPDWDNLDEDDRSYWQHHARAVRRAVARGGFKDGGE